jgi:hypothetical protein
MYHDEHEDWHHYLNRMKRQLLQLAANHSLVNYDVCVVAKSDSNQWIDVV